MNVDASEEEQLKVAEEYENYLNQFNAQLDTEGSYVYGSNLADASSQMSALFGGVFFIGIFLSIIFMVGTVLVIYYKQISEGYEDRERFIILQKVGLDQKQIKQTINKQVLTVFFPSFALCLHTSRLCLPYAQPDFKSDWCTGYDYDVDCDLVYLRYLPHRLCADFYDYFKKLSQDCANVKRYLDFKIEVFLVF